jgi:uncharacterized protein YgbK (DUF1537 family)
VAADDRTGAFETAAALADRGVGPVPVSAWPAAPVDAPVAVIDLACRHLSPADAAERAAQIPSADIQAHKTDSTLRGNWADELVARSSAAPVLLVPALPSQGRTCVGGVVYDHGRPVHEGAAGTDVRRRVLTARPAEALRAAGGRVVHELADDEAVAAWLGGPDGVAVADADDDEVIDRIVERWMAHARGVVLAGTSAVVAGAAGTVAAGRSPEALPAVDGPVLVVCGSVHPASRRQLDFTEHRGVPVTYLADDISARALEREGALVFASEIPVGDVTEPMAVAAAASLARGVADFRRHTPLGALILVGGDTASAVLGDAAVSVHGSVDVGTAWARVDRIDVPVITRSGGFGSDSALSDLLGALGRS